MISVLSLKDKGRKKYAWDKAAEIIAYVIKSKWIRTKIEQYGDDECQFQKVENW